MTPHPSTRPIALVTGASSGIGLDMAKILAKKGYDLILVARRADRLQVLQEEITSDTGVKVHAIPMDLTTPQCAVKLHQLTKEKFVEVLINNAGFGEVGDFEKMSLKIVEEMVNLNITALTMLTRLYGADMVRKKKGKILLVSSIASFQPCPYFSEYSATKAYVASFGEALHAEWKPLGVTVTTLYPGNTATEFHQVAKVKHNPITFKGGLSSPVVAQAGIDALFKGKPSIIPGFNNQIQNLIVRFFPKQLVTRAAGYVAGKYMKSY